jgi:hypothetical protein
MGRNIEMDLKETGWQVVGWIDRIEEREKWQAITNTVTELWVP